MSTSSNVPRSVEQRSLTLACTSLRTTLETLEAAVDYTTAAGRYGWAGDLRAEARRVRALLERVEANR
jgi:hypothetical protein